MAPYFKDIVCYVGQSECYESSSALIEKTMSIEVDDNTIHRLCNEYGEKSELWLAEERTTEQGNPEVGSTEVLYAHCDSGMVLTRPSEWKEVKVGRIYSSGDLMKVYKDRGYINNSRYTFHLGGHEKFEDQMSDYLDDYEHLKERLVVIIDGDQWLEKWVTAQYPKATQILDFYHAMEHIAKFGKLSKTKKERIGWMDQIREILLEKGGQAVVDEIKKMHLTNSKTKVERKNLLGYLERNLFRMNYPAYRKKGLQIGSGAMEAAHRTLVQKRCKLSGQRWSKKGATNIIRLRNLNMNNQWYRLTNHL